MERHRHTALPFLTAEWLDMAMFNWHVPPELLAPYVPRGTELDTWNGGAYMSLVAFRFSNTRLMKVAIPAHTAFEEINLRLYVKRCVDGEVRRGVVFIKEVAPRVCVVLIARRLYHENYVFGTMSHRVDSRDGRRRVEYDWSVQGQTHSLAACTDAAFEDTATESHEAFIVDHYWGYSAQRDGGTIEYRVAHRKWKVAQAASYSLDCDAVSLYGDRLAKAMLRPPDSVFLVDGSPVELSFGRRLK